MKLSACLITKNEELNIARCIESFRDLVDETIVVDTGSADRTVEIAKNRGAKVYPYKWDHNFANARNFAIEKAKGDWIVFLDADEYFTEGVENLLDVVRAIKPEDRIDALLCQCYDTLENGQVASSGYRMRIFRNHKSIRYEGNIHEHLTKDGQKPSFLYIPESQIKIYHTGYANDLIVREKSIRNLRFLLDELKCGRETPAVHAYLSYCYNGLNDYERAIYHARQFLEAGCSSMPSHNVKVYLNLLTAMADAGYDFETVYSESKLALTKFSDHPDLYSFLGLYLFEHKKYNEAIGLLNETIKKGLVFDQKQAANWPSYLYYTYFVLGQLYEFKNDLLKAEEYYILSLRENKRHKDTLVKLLTIIKQINSKGILGILQSIYDENDREDIELLLEVLVGLRVNEPLIYYYKQWTKKFGDEQEVLPIVLLTSGQYKKAFRYLKHCYVTEKNKWAGILAVVAALLSTDSTMIKELRNYVDGSLAKLIDCCRSSDKTINLTSEDVEYFSIILNEFIYLNANKLVDSFIRLSNRFNLDVSDVIGNLFFNAGQYSKAVEYFCAASKYERPNRAELFYKTGFCFYKIQQFKEAAKFFKLALLFGHNGQDISEFITWINERTKVEREYAFIFGLNGNLISSLAIYRVLAMLQQNVQKHFHNLSHNLSHNTFHNTFPKMLYSIQHTFGNFHHILSNISHHTSNTFHYAIQLLCHHHVT